LKFEGIDGPLSIYQHSSLMSSTSDNPTRQFLESWFYDTLNTLFNTVVNLKELTPEVADELRRLVLRPNDVRIHTETEGVCNSV